MIKKLHHNAYRCRDSEQTRCFYEDFLGLRLACTLEIDENTLHTFYELDDGSYLAFFEVAGVAFEFKRQQDYDMHVALEVEERLLEPMMVEASARGIEARGVSDHGFIHSVYFRDPNGYVIELAARMPNHTEATDPKRNAARLRLDEWQAKKQDARASLDFLEK